MHASYFINFKIEKKSVNWTFNTYYYLPVLLKFYSMNTEYNPFITKLVKTKALCINKILYLATYTSSAFLVLLSIKIIKKIFIHSIQHMQYF